MQHYKSINRVEQNPLNIFADLINPPTGRKNKNLNNSMSQNYNSINYGIGFGNLIDILNPEWSQKFQNKFVFGKSL